MILMDIYLWGDLIKGILRAKKIKNKKVKGIAYVF